MLRWITFALLVSTLGCGEHGDAPAQHSWIGIRHASLSHFDQDRTGALILRVWPQSPAAKAGLQERDKVFALNGRPVSSARQLDDWIKDLAVDEAVSIAVQREGRVVQVTVVPTRSRQLALNDTEREDNDDA